jgi:hypothetical protein
MRPALEKTCLNNRCFPIDKIILFPLNLYYCITVISKLDKTLKKDIGMGADGCLLVISGKNKIVGGSYPNLT